MENNSNLAIYFRETGGEILTSEEEKALFLNLEDCQEALVRTRLTHDCLKCSRVKKEIIEKNLRYVIKIARGYIGRGLPLEDLIQEGNLGLIRAISKFEVRKGYRFTTYATWWIKQSVYKAIGDKSRLIKIPFHRIERIQKLFTEFKKNDVSNAKFSDFVLSLESSNDALNLIADAMVYFVEPKSLDSEKKSNNLKSHGSFSLGMRLKDRGEDIETVNIKVSAREKLEEYVKNLPERRQIEIMSKRYGLLGFYGKPHTLEQIGEEFVPKLTKWRIRQIERKCLKILKNKMKRNPEDCDMLINTSFMPDRI